MTSILSHALFNHIQETLWMGRGDIKEKFWQKQQRGPVKGIGPFAPFFFCH